MHSLIEGDEEIKKAISRISDSYIGLDRDWNIVYVNQEAARDMGKTIDEIQGENIFSAFPGFEGSSFEKRYRYALENNESVHFQEYFPPLNSWFSVNAYPSEEGLSIYFQDVTPIKRADKKLEKEARRKEKMRNLLRMVVEDGSHVEIMQEAVKIVVNGIETDYGGVLKFENGCEKLEQSVSYGINVAGIGEEVAKLEESQLFSKLLREKEPISIKGLGREETEEEIKIGCVEFRSCICALIGRYDKPWGVILTASKREMNFTDEDEVFVQTVANILATMLEEISN